MILSLAYMLRVILAQIRAVSSSVDVTSSRINN
jgi:hypothetical protein